MIEPHGGVLVDRFLTKPGEVPPQESFATLPRVSLSAQQLSDLELIANGAFSPLEGFLTREAYASILRSMRLPNGTVWPIPIALAVNRTEAASLKEGTDVALVDTEGAPAGILHLEERYLYDKEEEARLVYRTTDEAHPGVRYLYQQGEVLLGGKVHAFPRPASPLYGSYPSRPAESRRLFAERGWQSVVGFQTRNPIHRAHEYIQKCALEIVDGLFIHPLVGETQPGDIPAKVRMRCYEALIQGYYPRERVSIGVLPAFMRYAGPREAILHALVRKNYGCSHFIVGRDHAGVGSYYGPYDAQHIFQEFESGELGITPIFFENSFFCTLCGAMATSKTCPHEEKARVSLSGTQVREMLGKGQRPPPEFTRPEVADILVEAARGT